MPMLNNELARRGNAGFSRDELSGIELRALPLRVAWEFDDLVAQDGHEIRIRFACSVRALSAPTEVRMLREMLMGSRDRVTDREVSGHFHPALRSAVLRDVESQSAPDLLTDDAREALTETLRKAAHGIAFACGVETLPPFSLTIESPGLQRQRIRKMQHELAEQQAAGQIEQVRRTAELLKQFQTLRAATPELPVGTILQQVNPPDQASLLRALVQSAGSTQGAANLFAVAGPYLVLLEPDAEPARTLKPKLFPLPPTLGPLRSASATSTDGSASLIIGARSGLMIIETADLESAEEYSDPSIQTQLGFSSAAYLRKADEWCGCHGEAGIVFWRRGETREPIRTIRTVDLPQSTPSSMPAVPTYAIGSVAVSMVGGARSSGPRNVCSLDGTSAIFNLGAKLGVARSDGSLRWLETASSSEIVSILPADRKLFVVHEDGVIATLDATGRIIRTDNRGGRVVSAALLPWLGGERLMLACRDGPIQCVSEDDATVTQYVAPQAGLRILAAASDRVAAVSPDRQRLILWDSWDGRKPAGEVYIGGLARHRIADICFG